MAFRMEELIGVEVCVEFANGEIVAGVFDSSVGDFVCIRGNTNHPYLINDRYIKMIFPKPEGTTDDN